MIEPVFLLSVCVVPRPSGLIATSSSGKKSSDAPDGLAMLLAFTDPSELQFLEWVQAEIAAAERRLRSQMSVRRLPFLNV